jgi:hypothetical protein
MASTYIDLRLQVAFRMMRRCTNEKKLGLDTNEVDIVSSSLRSSIVGVCYS